MKPYDAIVNQSTEWVNSTCSNIEVVSPSSLLVGRMDQADFFRKGLIMSCGQAELSQVIFTYISSTEMLSS